LHQYIFSIGGTVQSSDGALEKLNFDFLTNITPEANASINFAAMAESPMRIDIKESCPNG